MKKSKVIIFSLVSVGIVLIYNFSLHKNFTTEQWLSSSWNKRQFLVNDFLDKYDVIGMNRDEIIELLGNQTSDDSNYSNYNIRNQTDSNLVYDFGQKFCTPGSNIALIINFNSDGVVSDYNLITYSQ